MPVAGGTGRGRVGLHRGGARALVRRPRSRPSPWRSGARGRGGSPGKARAPRASFEAERTGAAAGAAAVAPSTGAGADPRPRPSSASTSCSSIFGPSPPPARRVGRTRASPGVKPGRRRSEERRARREHCARGGCVCFSTRRGVPPAPRAVLLLSATRGAPPRAEDDIARSSLSVKHCRRAARYSLPRSRSRELARLSPRAPPPARGRRGSEARRSACRTVSRRSPCLG